MAIRFHRGGKLVVFGNGVPTTDAQHISVEFVHPVIVGKRALPSISLTSDVATITGIARLEGFDQGAKRHEPGRVYEEPDTRDEEQGGKARPAGTSTARYSTGVHPEGAESQTGTEIPPGDQGG